MTLFAARLLSILAYPYLLVVSGSFLVLFKRTNDLWTSFIWTLTVIGFTAIVLIFELVGMRMGMFSNFDISKRTQRTPFYLFVLLILSAFIITAFAFHAPIWILEGSMGGFIGISIMVLVNRKVKASIHLASLSSLLLTAAFLYGSIFYFALLLIPLVAWSRVKMKRHTVSETIYGAILGFVITLSAYAVIQYLHL